MKSFSISRDHIKTFYRIVHVLARIVKSFIVLSLLLFLFLRIFGVPRPILQKGIQHLNKSGIPITVDRVALTLSGWQAEDLLIYSKDPDEINPLLSFEKISFSVRKRKVADASNRVWTVALKAPAVNVSSSFGQSVNIPATSPINKITELGGSFTFLPNSINVSSGKMTWLGIQFSMNGSIASKQGVSNKNEPAKINLERKHWLTEKHIYEVEKQLNMFSLPTKMKMNIVFNVDLKNTQENTVKFTAYTDEFLYKGVPFSKASIRGKYDASAFTFERIGFWQGNQSLQASLKYNIRLKQLEGALNNTITSNQFISFLPLNVRNIFQEEAVRMNCLPRFDLKMTPAPIHDLLNHLSGHFSINDVSYQEVEIETLEGDFFIKENRFEGNHIKASVLDQPNLAKKTGSAMKGGQIEGSVLWDGNTREYRVDINGGLDPNLLVPALARIPIATNIIQRFKFEGKPLHGHLVLGANITDKDSFYIDVQAVAKNVIFQGVRFSSINLTESYKRGVLSLSPLVGMQGINFLKGDVEIDFFKEEAQFDIKTSLNPRELEDLIYAPANLFGTKINVDGKVRIDAYGLFDWGGMQRTDFSANVQADQLKLPILETENFTAKITGKGPLITVQNAKFNLYEGTGVGKFSFAWNPSTNTLPYDLLVKFDQLNFKPFLQFYWGEKPVISSGKMSGDLRIAADLTTNFFTVANGEGFLKIEKGQLVDLPLFAGFSRMIRKLIPKFNTFSINNLSGNFEIKQGVIYSKDIYFGGNLLSAKGKGNYTSLAGFDAVIQVQLFNNSWISSIIRVVTDPFLRIFEMKLKGSLSDPKWELENF